MSSALTVVKQQEVIFYQDTLTAVLAADGNVYVAIRQMCKALGIDAQGQRRRMERHTILVDGLKGVDNLSTPGGVQSGYMLRVDLVPLWLSGIRTKAVREEIRPKLERFQKEAARVLWEAFQRGELTTDNNDVDDIAAIDPEAVEALRIAESVVRLARSHVRLLRQVQSHASRLDAIEAELGNTDRFITVSQAAQLSDAVRAIGLVFSKVTGRNEYGGVYGELYRRFGINSYLRLPAKKYDEAMGWLRQWYDELTDGEDAPF